MQVSGLHDAEAIGLCTSGSIFQPFARLSLNSDPGGNVELHIVGYMHNDPADILQQVSDAVDDRINGGMFSDIIRKWRRRLFVH